MERTQNQPAIPFQDLAPQHRQLSAEILAAVQRVVERGWFILGAELTAFEGELADYLGVRHCVGVASGTDALQVGLLALGVGPGDEVITVAHTAVPTVAAICQVGARPVFVDVDPVTMTMDPTGLATAMTGRTRAIIPVHLYGQPADMDPILAVAGRAGVPVLEDVAQAHGARYRNRPVGTLGRLGAFSFYPTKNLGACGDAGAVVTDDDELARQLRLLRNYGQQERYCHVRHGMNSRLDEIQAAILRVKLPYLEPWNAARRRRAATYRRLLAGIEGLTLPAEPTWAHHVYHLFVVRHAGRDGLKRTLERAGIGTLIHYPVPVHRQPAYAHLGWPAGSLPESERAAATVLSLPLSPDLDEVTVERVSEAIRRAVESLHHRGAK